MNKDLSYRLINIADPTRIYSVLKLNEFLIENPKFIKKRDLKIASISGGTEPEIDLFDKDVDVTYLNYDDNPNMWDLTKNWEGKEYQYLLGTFDFVFCEQILEHLSDPEMAFKNLNLLLKKDGILHCSVPGICGIHMDPNWYYSGFHPRLLNKWAKNLNIEIIHSFFWGSPKCAKMYSNCEFTPLVYSGGIEFFLPLFFSLLKKGKLKILLRVHIPNLLIHNIKYIFQDMWSENFITPVYTVFMGKKR